MRIESVNFKPEDVIVIQFPYDRYNIDTLRSFAETINETFKDNRIILLPEDLTLSVFSRENGFI